MNASGAAVEVDHLAKRFPPDVNAVSDLSFAIRRGEVFGLLGPNGAGKTTTMRMMMGMLTPTAGGVRVLGEEIRPWRQDIKARMGICPQEPVLWDDLTCLEHLTLVGAMYDVPAGTVRVHAGRLLRELQLEDKARTVARNLSGGMKRRLNLALALVHEPEVVILDEPTAGLDPQSRALLWDYIRALSATQGKTVVLTTHFMDEADRLAHRIAVMDHGQLLVLDTPDALKASIGEGDVLELTLDAVPRDDLLADLRAVPGVSRVTAADGTLAVQALDAVSRLQAIFGVLSRHDVTAGGVRFRSNTLEDVFLKLTGRSLRED
jgi:ABC-2 type transport system ATP-binding protein